MSQVLTLWRRATGLPVLGPTVGTRLFSLAFGLKAPYFLSVRPRFVEIRPGYAELVVPKRWGVQNHLGTLHAIALCNGLEAAMGALAEASIPPDKRWIPQGMDVRYTAKATSDVTCVAETDPDRWSSDEPDLPVRVRGTREDGTVVVEGTIHLWVTRRPGGPRD